ncbi:MAG: pyridoxamine 5'-phosphate oxidase family protein, partial [Clostridia bacterium]|nr:pyridoxamine 5'-phosphate oxidase family protein [Clostridia bacterium]
MDFEQENERFEQYLSSHHIWVLATGSHDEISARSMSIITIGPKIYFQTDAGFEKTRHITENPNVALCCGNYQVKGTARILGLTIDEKNVPIMDLYKNCLLYTS